MSLPIPNLRSRHRGCLLGGAVGDALGAPIEFVRSNERLCRMYPPAGVTGYVPGTYGPGAITDDTQMTLFTAEGLLRAAVAGSGPDADTAGTNMAGAGIPEAVHLAYLRWLHTQGGRSRHPLFQPEGFDGWLIGERRLFARRAPGNTCLTALEGGVRGTVGAKLNDSKGCGGVMRAAPVGLFVPGAEAFRVGCETAAITHSHPSGYLAAGFLALLVHELLQGATLDAALDAATGALVGWEGHDECLEAVDRARALARTEPPGMETVSRIGGGWVAEEALAIAVYAALAAEGDFRRGVLLAVNHRGDSDSTGAICGNILGVMLGEEAIPPEWLAPLELGGTIRQMADDLHDFPLDPAAARWRSRYPVHERAH